MWSSRIFLKNIRNKLEKTFLLYFWDGFLVLGGSYLFAELLSITVC